MLAETEMLIKNKKIRNDSIDSNDGQSVTGMGAKQSKEAEEAALDDENLCPICFNKTKDT